jgi:TonB-dependent receptor
MITNRNGIKSLLLGTSLLAGIASLAAFSGAYAQDSDTIETVMVTGYRASLASSTMTKKQSVGFSDAVFAEDIGKFPDTNLAEALNRIPGITLSRDINGEGVNISIRGLGTNFTKITLNNAQIAIATSGATDATNNNREVDLNMFPSELFTELQVDKSPRAELLEGGAAGNVNMRTRRPFDNPGFHFTYVAQGIDNTLSNGLGGNGALVVSDTWNSSRAGEFGILVGITGRRTYNYVEGWEDGNGGWDTPTINNATMCGSSSGCDITGSTESIGGNAMSLPATIPSGVSIPGYSAGDTVDAAMLEALNPGMTTTRLGNMLIPRMARSMYQRGTRDRYNGVASFEWRPNENMHFYLDMIAGRQFNDLDRSDFGLGFRSGNGAQSMIMANTVTDANNVTLSSTLYNAQFFLEARQYKENSDFFSINPGMEWHVNDLLEVDFQLNASRSHFLRDSPTIMIVTCPSTATAIGCTAPDGGVIADFDNSYRNYPHITTNIDVDDPANFQWSNGRVNLQAEKRYTFTDGAHLDVKYGGERLAVKAGAAWDDTYRGIAAIDGSTDWAKMTCGGGSSSTCSGSDGSLIPRAELASYLGKGPNGFVSVNYDKFKNASDYYAIDHSAIASVSSRCKDNTGSYFATASMSGTTSGCYEERVVGLYAQMDGVFAIGDRDLNYDLGLRWVETHQSIFSPVYQSAETFTLFNGESRSYNVYDFSNGKHTYQAFLPSASLVYHVTDDFLVRASVSRTMTRPNVSTMISAVSFSAPEAASAGVGNPGLKPYFSNNIDLGFEYYTGGEGYFSLAAFRKGISGFTTSQTVTKTFGYLAPWGITWDTLSETQQANLTARWGCNSQATCATAAEVSVTEQINASGMETINGLEIGYVQPLDFLLEKYGAPGFGMTANVTIVDQSSSGSAAVHATGVAPYTFNLTGYYDHDGIMARLSYVYSARTYNSGSNVQNVCLPNTTVSISGCPEGAYLFASPYGQADFSSSMKLSHLVGEVPSDPELTFSIQNLFNAKQRSYFQWENATHSYYQKGMTVMFGVHGTF